MKINSIQMRIGLYIAICSVIISSVLGLSSFYLTNQTQLVTERQSNVLVGGLTKDNLLAEVNMGAMVLHEELMSTLGRADALALSFATIKQEQKRGNIDSDEVRTLVNAVLKRSLTDNPGDLGITAAWEPGALSSGGDAVLPDSGHDRHGRFVPYWSRGQGGLSIEPLTGYEDSARSGSGDRVGEYYLCPRDTGHACVLNPFKYSVQGKEILMTTMAAPISVDNQFQGIVGIDMSVDFLNRLAAGISQRVFQGRNQVFILSPNGKVAGHSRSEGLGHGLPDGVDAELLENRQASVEFNDERIQAFAPIELEGTGSRWSVLLQVPNTVVFEQKGKIDRAIMAANSSSRNWQLLIAIIVTLAAVSTTYVISGRIVQPIRAAVAMLQRVAEGDLRPRLSVEAMDETALLSDACNGFLDKTQPVIHEVIGSADALSAAAEEASVVSEQTRRGVIQQQSELLQLATAAEEMAATSANVSENAADASKVANQSHDAAEQSQQIVETMRMTITGLAAEVRGAAEVIDKLSSDSREIHSILDVIQAITEQTNLLALNAAIEAARAGEHGRGFAVVADEVRSLALRTRASTAEIQQMIERLQTGSNQAVKVMQTSQQQAVAGVEQAQKTSQALEQILTAIDKINDLNIQVASAAEQQSAVAADISQGIANVSQVAEEVADGARQAAEGSGELARISTNLTDKVNQFTV